MQVHMLHDGRPYPITDLTGRYGIDFHTPVTVLLQVRLPVSAGSVALYRKTQQLRVSKVLGGYS
jgi:hypothetical protein